MKKRSSTTVRVFVLATIAIAAVTVGYGLMKRKREAGYRATLSSYTTVLKPGMPRQQVEDFLIAKNVVFDRKCCYSERSTFADVTKIGEEKVFLPLCNKEYVAVVFEFKATEPHDWNEPYPSDKLKGVTMDRSLDCV